MKRIKPIIIMLLAVVLSVGVFSLLTGCSCSPESEPEVKYVAQPTDFIFDEATGQFSFTGVENAGYYFVRVFGYNEVLDVDNPLYCATSERIAGGTGAKSGVVATSGFVCGPYRAKLLIYPESGTDYKAPEPVMKKFYTQTGTKLITPHFKATSNGNSIKLYADGYVLATYIKYQCFPVFTYTIKDSGGNTVQTVELKLSDIGYDVNLVSMQNNFAFGDSLEKNLNLSPGTYKITAKAVSPTTGSQILSSDVSEEVTLTVTADGSDEKKTAYWDEPTNPGFGFGFVVGDGRYQFSNPEILAYTDK